MLLVLSAQPFALVPSHSLLPQRAWTPCLLFMQNAMEPSIQVEQPWPAHASPSAFLTAEDEGGSIVGRCGLEVKPMTDMGITPSASGIYGQGSSEESQPRVLLRELVVEERCRRQGLGRKLCMQCEAVARSWGFDEIMLFVDERNTNAVALYEKIGYAFVVPPSPPLENAVVDFFRKVTADPVAMRKQLGRS